jgi:hypothetical protein
MNMDNAKAIKEEKSFKKVYLTKEEVNSLKEFCDDNLAIGTVLITQSSESGIGLTTKVMVKDLPETLTDITDIDSW